MNKYFNILLEFDKDIVHNTIETAISTNRKGYVCAIESNNLSIANKDNQFKNVINHALVNVCDGSNVAWLLGIIHNKKFDSYIGNNIFLRFIMRKKHKQYFIGNTRPVLDSLKNKLSKIDPNIEQMEFQELPFKTVNEFDYEQIADLINKNAPDIIWVSLGAPKQELFMSMLLPYLHKGVMFGIGAAFNFNADAGCVKRAPKWMLNCRLEWLYRACEEPKKNIPRYWNFIMLLPQLVFQEWRTRT